jgi:hypothetical protein
MRLNDGMLVDLIAEMRLMTRRGGACWSIIERSSLDSGDRCR